MGGGSRIVRRWAERAGWAALLSVGVNMAMAAVGWSALSAHARGWGQGVGDYINAMVDLVQGPGHALAMILGVHRDHHIGTHGWAQATMLNLGFYFVAGIALGVARGWWRDRTEGDAPVSPERRRALKGLATAAATGAGGVLGYAFFVEPRRLAVERLRIALADLPRELEGLRLVHVTDVHHGPWRSLESVRGIVARVNELEADLVVLTGDYVHRSPAYIAPAAEALSGLRAKIGRVGVLGNHDWWEGGERSKQALTEAGIVMVDNGRVFVTRQRALAREATEGLCIAGVGDLMMDRQDYAAALGNIAPGMPRVLLSHHPDVAEEPGLVEGGRRVDLMLCGHTHGGQLWFPGLGTPGVPSAYGRKYGSGLVRGPVCPVFICRGAGSSLLPLRLGVAPEVAVIELVGVEGTAPRA